MTQHNNDTTQHWQYNTIQHNTMTTHYTLQNNDDTHKAERTHINQILSFIQNNTTMTVHINDT